MWNSAIRPGFPAGPSATLRCARDDSFFVCRLLALYTLHEPACFMRKWLIFFGPVCRKGLAVKKIKFFIFLGNSKIVQTDFMLSRPGRSGMVLNFEFPRFRGDKLSFELWFSSTNLVECWTSWTPLIYPIYFYSTTTDSASLILWTCIIYIYLVWAELLI